MKYIVRAIFILVTLSYLASCAVVPPASDMDFLLSKMKTISASSKCNVNEECGSMTLGWSQCAIDNLEFPINIKNKPELKLMMQTANQYETLWKKGVASGQIDPNCKPQKFSKKSCYQNRCVLVGSQEQPKTPPETVPNLQEKLLAE
jgi:hypothetical protein